MSTPDRFPPHVVALADQDLAGAGRAVDHAMDIYLESRDECGSTGVLIDLIAALGDLSEPAIVGLAAAAVVRLTQAREQRR